VFEKDMAHAKWAEVYGRQEGRAALVREWLDALELSPGQRLLDVGCGPGYASLRAAERVGPEGRVYAVDRVPDALAFLAQLQAEQGLPQIERILADAEAGPAADPLPQGFTADAALVTMMLHHTNNPTAVLRFTAGLVRTGARAVVAEFHPDGPCDHGPTREHRIAPEQARAWCEESGFAATEYRRQSSEHYMLLLMKKP
jgi:ubiquinone/menaquinone biosynthesis C-methylase UbiE